MSDSKRSISPEAGAVSNEIKRLSVAIAQQRCVIFAGAGLTVDSGGATWSQLVEYLIKKFKYTSPLKDTFQIVGDLCKKNGYDVTYRAVQERLKDAKVIPPVNKLAALPWFTAFTTNYDTGLENALAENQKKAVRKVFKGDEFALTGINSELLCVKLMGSVDALPGQLGAMVLDQGDLSLAETSRAQLFDLLERHAANLSFLFVGYSFDDGIFIKILEKLNKILGNPSNTHYALFKDKPSEEKAYLFESLKVQCIVQDLKDFSSQISEQVKLHNPNDFSLKGLQLGADVVPIKSVEISNFLSRYNPVLSENFRESVNANSFLKGQTESFYPFVQGWHFKRGEIDAIVNAVLDNSSLKDPTESKLVSVVGSPGSGRTFAIMAAIQRLVYEHRAVAIQVSNYAVRPIPAAEEFSHFVEGVNKSAVSAGIAPPKLFVFWSKTQASELAINQFLSLCKNSKHLVAAFVYEDTDPSQIELSLIKGFKRVIINTDVDLPSTQKTAITDYLMDAIRRHGFISIDRSEIEGIISDEKMFLAIVYRTLDPTKRSINKIVEEQFAQLADSESQNAVAICALASSLELEMPISVLRDSVNRLSGKDISYSDIYSLVRDMAGVFIKDSIDSRLNILLSIYHPLIAKRICTILGKDVMDAVLICIAQSLDLRLTIEAELAGSILIANGVNAFRKKGLPFSESGLEKALLALKSCHPARPILHHLARFYSIGNPEDPRIVPILEEALREPEKSYALVERQSNILTTLANVKWSQQKKNHQALTRKSPAMEEIFSMLDAARAQERGATPYFNAHAYDVHARILKELAKQAADDTSKIALISEALDIVIEGLENHIDDPETEDRLKALQIELLLEISIEDAEEKARVLLGQGNGLGYYTLAAIEYYKNSDVVKANQYLDVSLGVKIAPTSALRLKIELDLLNKSPDYKKLHDLVRLLTERADFRPAWKSTFQMAVIYASNENFKEAKRLFSQSHRNAPRYLQRRVQLFWMEAGARRTFRGTISGVLTEKQGDIHGHNIPGWLEGIFFDPRSQNNRQMLRPGLMVRFELGFSSRGPIAFDVRP
ncbi:MAG: SIR2 family protein [Candidatus Omnitrophota bacterium]